MNRSKKQKLEKAAGQLQELKAGFLDDFLAFRLRRTNGLVHQFFGSHFAPPDFIRWQFSVLQLLKDNPGSALKEVAHAIGIDHSTLVPTVDFVEKAGWVRRTRSAADRRRSELTITAEGEKKLQGLRDLLNDHDEKITRRLTRSQRTSLMQLLKLVEEETEQLLRS